MNTYLLQDWCTMQMGGSFTTSVPQAAHAWLDLGYASDVTLFLEIAQLIGTPTFPRLRYETSPNRDPLLFRELGFIVPAVTTTPVVTRIATWVPGAIGLARWLRWRLTVNDVGGPTWDMTFRITVQAYAR